ncbi:MAG: adenylate kinase [Candidatus Eisenbacteria sp.]|nr:adenylate kinase [Candidatus Eisenbacteria bacterium]
MRLILLGAPGCGKGTHSAWMVEELGIPQISTGDILRDAVKEGSELGRQARSYMDSGELVPDSVILGLMRGRMAQPDAARGFILDGFPRTIPQAEGLNGALGDAGMKLDRVLQINVARDELIHRLTSRRVCPNCKAVYNLDFKPPKQGDICDACGASVVQRDDDREATVAQRLEVYERQTAPLIDYYIARGLVAVIDGNQGYAHTRAEIETALGREAKR